MPNIFVRPAASRPGGVSIGPGILDDLRRSAPIADGDLLLITDSGDEAGGPNVLWACDGFARRGSGPETGPVGRDVLDIVPGLAARTAAARGLRKAFTEGRGARGELWSGEKRGRSSCYECSVIPRLLDGFCTHFLVVLRDMTEQRRTEEREQKVRRKAEEAQELLESITARIPGAVYRMRFTEEGGYQFLFMSMGARALFGLGPDQATTDAEAMFGTIPEEDIQRIHAESRRCNAAMDRWDCEYRIETPGGLRWIRGVAKPFSTPDGRVYWDGVLTDITEQKRAAQIERQLHERITAIMESTTDSVFTLDADWRFTYLNERAKRQIARGGDLEGRTVWDAFPEARGTVAWREYHRVRDEGATRVFEFYYPPLGQWLKVHAHPLDGGVAVFFRDVSARKSADEALRTAKEAAEGANRAKSAFLANMSHELRTPLNAIMGFSDMMRGEMLGALGNPMYREYAADIYRCSEHLLSIINAILDLAKIEARALVLDEEEIAIPALLDEAVRTLAVQAEAKGIALGCDIPTPCPALVADRRAVMQVLLNLLSNAVKFTEKGEVRVTVAGGCESLTISVRDTGIGIGEAHLSTLGQPFRQVDCSLARPHEGIGIGLSVAKHLTELHGGQLLIESTFGIGTTVTILFPAQRTLPEARRRTG